MKRGDHAAAIELYTGAIELAEGAGAGCMAQQHTAAVCYANRSLCHLRLKRFLEVSEQPAPRRDSV